MKPILDNFQPPYEITRYYTSKSTLEEAWNDCPRGEWLLWWVSKILYDTRLLILAKGLCANTVRKYMTEEGTNALDAAIAFGRGEIDEEALREPRRKIKKWVEFNPHSRHIHANEAALAAIETEHDIVTKAMRAAYYASLAAYEFGAPYKQFEAEIENQKQTADICREILTDAVMAEMKKL